MGSEAAPGDTAANAPAAVLEPGAGFGGSDGLLRILVIGDALAGGFGAGLSRMAESDQRFEIVNRFNEASGLARPEIYDWAAAVPKIVIAKDYDAAIVHLGVNDRQAIRTPSGRLEFKSPEWTEDYKAKVGALVERLNGAGLRVYWLAIPPMGEPAFDTDMKFIGALQKEAIAQRVAGYIDLSRHFLAADGTYTDRGPDETGADRKLRARDGIAFMKQGNNRFGQLLLEAIKTAEAQQLGGDAGTILAASSPATPATEPGLVLETNVATGLPHFGQQGLDGEELAFNAEAINSGAANAGKAGVKAAAAPTTSESSQAQRPVIAAAVGSAAELLFTTGESIVPPAGRFDDFSMPALP